jgi:hypothetical protein
VVSIPAAGRAEEKMNPMLTALTPTSISGYVNTSAEWNPGTGNANPPGFAFNRGKQDGFNLDVVKLAIEKPLDESQWAAGYKVELLFGPDANALATGSSQASITSTGPGGGTITTPLANNSDFGIKQAYVALRAPVGNGLDFKLGVWDTIIGYETFDAGSNPNYTRSYGYTIEPTTHTGVLMSYQLCKYASASAGIANTFGPSINQRANPPKAESYKTYMGAIALTAPEDWGAISGSTFYVGIINGYNSGTVADQVSYYFGATINTPVKGLKVGASYDYLGSTAEFNGPLYANAVGVYTSFQATEKLSLHVRGEYATTDTGLLGTGSGFTGGNSKVTAATATIQYDLWANVLSRLELRWDHQAGDGEMIGYGGKLTNGSTSGSLRNYYTLALNVIYKF